MEPFRSRVDTTVVPVADRNPAAFGGGVGEGLQMLGQAGEQSLARHAAAQQQVAENQHRVAMLQQQRTVQQQTTDGLKDLESVQSDIAQFDQNLRNTIGAASPDYEAKLTEYRNKKTDDFLATYGTDPDLRERFVPMVARLRANLGDRAMAVAAEARISQGVQDSQDLSDRLYNSARTDKSPENIQFLMEKADAFLSVLPPMSPDKKREIAKSFNQRIALGAAEKAIDDDPHATLKTIDAGAFNDVLTGQQLEALRTHAETEIRRREAEARATQAVQLKATKEALATKEAELNTGAGAPTDYMALANQYQAIGDTSKAVELRAKGAQRLAVEGSRDWAPAQMQQKITELQAKPSLTPSEASLLSGLREQFQQSSQRLNGTGGALEQYVYATRKTLDPVDPAKADTMRARAQIAIAAAAQYGRPNVEPLLASEVDGFRQLAQGGPEQRLQALQSLAALGDPRAVYGAARQITSREDGAFRIAAMRLGIPGGRQLASDILRGPDAQKVIGKGWNQAGAMQAYQQYVGGALAGLGPEFAGDTFEAAKNIYASTMQAQGKSEWDPKLFQTSIERALGSYTDGQWSKGGSAVWKGFRVVVPTGWTADGVFGRLARLNGEGLGSAKVSGPGVWPDGSPLYTGQLRDGSLVPVLMTGTTYGFRSARSGRLLAAKDGGPFLLDMAKVPW